jgi:hypothetical protein
MHFQMDGIGHSILFCSIIEACLHSTLQDRKEAGTDLTQNLPNDCAVFQKNAVLEVSPRQSLGLLQIQARVEQRGIIMIRKLPVLALLIGALAVAGQAQAGGYYYHGGGHGGCCWGGGHGGWVGPAAVGAVLGAVVAGSVYANSGPRTVYVQQPVYVQPQPVYVQPQQVYVQPPPVYYQPQGYYVQPRY